MRAEIGTWTTVLRLAALLTGVSSVVVLACSSGLWLVEGGQPGRVVGVAVIGVVAAIVALAVARRVALEEEQAFEVKAGTLEHQFEARLDRIEAQLVAMDAQLQAPPGRRGRPPWTRTAHPPSSHRWAVDRGQFFE